MMHNKQPYSFEKTDVRKRFLLNFSCTKGQSKNVSPIAGNMELKTLTWDDFKQYNPCYDPHERYGDWQGTIIDLLNRDNIPHNDRIWAATKIIDDKTLRLFAVYCARDVAHLMKDERSLNALDVAERYAIGQATDDELAAARAAAGAAAGDAAWAAARAAQIKHLIIMIQNA